MSAMQSEFMNLPVEIIYTIAECTPYFDMVNLVSTCSFLRELLAPSIFRTVRVTNKAEDAESILSVIHKYGKQVKEINFVGTFESEGDLSSNSEDDVQQMSAVTPESILKLLSNSQLLLPGLEKICLCITANDSDQWNDCFWMRTCEADDPDFSEAEPLMDDIYGAISSNSTIKSLEIKAMLPIRAQIWETNGFQQFLGGLETFELSLWGGDNGAGWKTNTMPYYTQFCENLGNLFFKHLTSVISVRVESSNDGPLGDSHQHQIPFPLRPRFMPKCQNLELVCCFIGPAIGNFIISHAKVLKTLKLQDCDAEIYMARGTSWEAFLQAISQVGPVLTTLSIENTEAPLTRAEKFDQPEQGDMPDDVKKVRAILDDPSSGRKIFSYGYIDDKYGMHFKQETNNVKRFLHGGDQRAYDKLMGIVQSNASNNR